MPLFLPVAVSGSSHPVAGDFAMSADTGGTVSTLRVPPDGFVDLFWSRVREEAESMTAEKEELLDAFIHESVLKWESLEEALAAHLAGKLARSPQLTRERWQALLRQAFLHGVTADGERVSDVMRSDLSGIKDRDPACPGVAHALLFYKGFHGLQLYRCANVLWRRGQTSSAALLQSLTSEIFGMDIHPAATIGAGILIDHGTGIVIGETARVGPGCSLLHGVTLGGTGKFSGDRHPKLGANVLVGAGASILGNVMVGDGAKIGAAALVLTDIPARATAVGVPAKLVGRSKEDKAGSGMDTACRQVDAYEDLEHFFCPFRHLDHSKKGFLGPYEFAQQLQQEYGVEVAPSQALDLFFAMDRNNTGRLTALDFEENRPVWDMFLKRYSPTIPEIQI